MLRRSSIIALALVCGLAACGKAGRPMPPEDSTFPLQYPSASLIKGGGTLEEPQPSDPKQGYSANGHLIDPSARQSQTAGSVMVPKDWTTAGTLNGALPESPPDLPETAR